MKYDAIIIGSGQGGNPLAARLADHGWTVALIEKKYLGGTCINTGCTPTKTMVHRALVAHYARDAARWGVRTHDVSVDLAKIVAQKDELVQSKRQGQQKSIDSRPNLHLYRGVAQFTAPHEIKVGDQSAARQAHLHRHGSAGGHSTHFGAGLGQLPDQRNHHAVDDGARTSHGSWRRLHWA